ncbi:hypothetical protein ES703_04649 [subsurface metagenome]
MVEHLFLLQNKLVHPVFAERVKRAVCGEDGVDFACTWALVSQGLAPRKAVKDKIAVASHRHVSLVAVLKNHRVGYLVHPFVKEHPGGK